MSGLQRQCLGCKTLGHWGRTGRCTTCRIDTVRVREADPARRMVKQTRYDRTHRRIRQYWAPVVAMGSCSCARCHEPIDPHTPWDVDHLPDGTSQPSHASCNRAAITRTAS